VSCEADLEEARAALEAMTEERDQLLVIMRAAMQVMGTDQWAELRTRIKQRDSAV
jgi:hypothetical protein